MLTSRCHIEDVALLLSISVLLGQSLAAKVAELHIISQLAHRPAFLLRATIYDVIFGDQNEMVRAFSDRERQSFTTAPGGEISLDEVEHIVI